MEYITLLLIAGITAGTPLLYGALGEILAERSGILNLGIEGMMLIGAVTGFMTVLATESLWLGILVAILCGMVAAGVHAVLCIVFKADQIVSGLALTIFGTGFSAFLGAPIVGTPAPVRFARLSIAPLSDIPFLGPIFFTQNFLVYISYFLVPLVWYFLFRTDAGLKLRAVGENPAAADAVGIPVYFTRFLYTMIGGGFAGLAGAYLSLAYTTTWMEGMTAGRGWIVIALVIFAAWNPSKAIIGAYLFGAATALGFRFQFIDIPISAHFWNMSPYLVTIIVLIFATLQTRKHRIGQPGALLVPYDREDK